MFLMLLLLGWDPHLHGKVILHVCETNCIITLAAKRRWKGIVFISQAWPDSYVYVGSGFQRKLNLCRLHSRQEVTS